MPQMSKAMPDPLEDHNALRRKVLVSGEQKLDGKLNLSDSRRKVKVFLQ